MEYKCQWYVKRDGAFFRGYMDCQRSDGREETFRSVVLETYALAKDWAKTAASTFRTK